MRTLPVAFSKFSTASGGVTSQPMIDCGGRYRLCARSGLPAVLTDDFQKRFSARFFRLHHGHDQSIRPEIFLRDGLDLFQGDGFVFGVVKFRALVAEAIKLVERGRGGEMAEFLPRDLFLADD